MEDTGRRNIKLDQAKYIDTYPLSRASGFNVIAQGVRQGFNNFSGGFPET